MLDYDNSAFYYFMLTVLGFYLVPSVLYIVYRFLAALGSTATKGRKLRELGRTDAEREKAKKYVDKNSGLKTLFTTGFIVNFIFTLVAVALCYYLVLLVWENTEIASFDPYQILGIDQGSDDKVIKKAYRMMSLKYHPDKNPGNKQAEEIFMKVAKAYEALTDETAKENWEKYGNPDGKQALEVSIGLPTFLLEKENQNLILVLYLLLLVVVIPVLVGLWYARSKQYGEKNVMYDTYAYFNHMLNEQITVKMMPEVYAGASEFMKLNQSQRIKQSLLDKLKDRGMQKEKYAHIKVIHNGNAMIHAHLFHVEVPAALREDTGRMLARSPELIDALLDLAASHQWMGAAVRVLEFSQYLTQGLFHRDSPFAQLPHLGPEGVKAIMAAKGSVAEKNLPAFLAKKDAEKPGLAKLSPEQREECLAVCKILPDLETAVEVFVEDEEQVAEGDLVTCKVTLTRRNVPEGGKCPTVHAPAYPLPRREAWHALLTSREGKIMGMARITGQGREAVGEVKFMVQRAGPYLFELHLKSLDYLGLDRVHPVKFTVVPAAQLPQYVPHPDDVKLDDEPTLFEQAMMAANVEEDTDSESEDEDEDEEDEEDEEPAEEGTTNGGNEDAGGLEVIAPPPPPPPAAEEKAEAGIELAQPLVSEKDRLKAKFGSKKKKKATS
mmetsp:Transcript_36914/g.57635  ORF Transcript_36914/g.57635 Transcript_36914/m.57635 type:complete len:665 (+) Transcript_36914:89-2083(+)